MITALARQELSRTEEAGVLARAALAVGAERMGGRPPAPFVPDEKALRAKILQEIRRRLGIAPDDWSDEALRTIEDALDTEMEAIAEPVDVEAGLVRAAALVAGALRLGEATEENANSRTPSLFDRMTATFRRQRSEWRGERARPAAEEESATEIAGAPDNASKKGR
jgi:hypothetical protein